MYTTNASIDWTKRKVLDQNKLDAVNKGRSNIFNWKGQFTPDFISYIIQMYANPEDVIADPFSGSGTVLIESLQMGHSCIGFEINPSAYFMSSFFKYANLTVEERNALYDKILSYITPIARAINKEDMVYKESPTFRESYKSLLELSSLIAQTADKSYIPFLINVLFLCEKDKSMTLIDAFRKNFSRMRVHFYLLPYSSSTVNVHLSDAKNIGKQYDSCIDLIITSPPYINVFNYHQNYRGIVEAFGFNVLKVASSEIGSNRKNRSNRFKTVVQYSEDMGVVLFEAIRSLKVGGTIIAVVGRESMVRKTRFYNSRIIVDLVGCIPSAEITSIETRHFFNRYGEDIKEDIIFIRKIAPTSLCCAEKFKDVGIRHIEQAIDYAQGELKNDLISVIKEQQTIYESPIFL